MLRSVYRWGRVSVLIGLRKRVSAAIEPARIIRKDRKGQDMVEYSLAAAFIAIAVAAFLPPTIAPAMSTVFSKIVAVMRQV